MKITSGRLIDEAIIQGKFPARGMAQAQECVMPHLQRLAEQLDKLDFGKLTSKQLKEFYTDYCKAIITALYTQSPQGRFKAIRYMTVLSI